MSSTRYVQKSHNHDLGKGAFKNGETCLQSCDEARRLIEAAGGKYASILEMVGNETFIVVDTGYSKDFMNYQDNEEVRPKSLACRSNSDIMTPNALCFFVQSTPVNAA